MKLTATHGCTLALIATLISGCGSEQTQSQKNVAPITDSYESYVDTLNFGPLKRLNLNTASLEDLGRIPGVTPRMVREFDEYRPYVSIAQYRKEIGKYVDEAMVAQYEKYLYVPVEFNESDSRTIEQIPGITSDKAARLIAGRPYVSRKAFLDSVRTIGDGTSEQFARHYLSKQ